MTDQVESQNQVEENLEKEFEKSEQRVTNHKIQVVKLYVATVTAWADEMPSKCILSVAGHSVKHARALLRLLEGKDLPFSRLTKITYEDMSLKPVEGTYDDFVENGWLEPEPSRVSIVVVHIQ